MDLTDKYLSADLYVTAEELKLRESLLNLRLGKIVDFHVHYGAKWNMAGIDKDIFSNLISTYPYFEVDHHARVNKLFYGPEQEVVHVVLPFPMRGWDHKASNRYLKQIAGDDKAGILPFLMGVFEDVGYTVREILSGSWYGIKMYPKQLDFKARRITDFYPEEILAAINEMGLCIMLHLPNDIIRDWPELARLMSKYPKAVFILAHFGLSRDCQDRKSELKKLFRQLREYPNVYLDTAWFFEEDILFMGLEEFGHEKVLYATDQPINLVRCEFFRHPVTGKDRVLSANVYHWVDADERKEYLRHYPGDISKVLSVHFKIIRSIFEALKKYDCRHKVYEDVFCKNALRALEI